MKVCPAPHINLHAGWAFPICAPGVGRTRPSPTWSDPEGSSHNDFASGRSAPTARIDSREPLNAECPMEDARIARPRARPARRHRAKPASAPPYRVLARKYRPQTFAELIGQDAMVRRSANAIARGRLAHAFLITGVRGVGKTSTARLIAKALNCIGPDGQGGPTIDPCGVCEPCVAIAEGRHIDVIEMDAASHTGVDDVREIIEAVRYASVSRALQDLHHRRSPHAVEERVQRAAEDARGTAAAREVPVRHHRGRQAAGHGAVALPAVRPEAHPGREARSAFRLDLPPEGVEAEPEALAIIAPAAEGSAATACRSSTRRSPTATGRVTRRAGARHARPGRQRPHPAAAARCCSTAIRGARSPRSTRRMRSASSRPPDARADGTRSTR